MRLAAAILTFLILCLGAAGLGWWKLQDSLPSVAALSKGSYPVWATQDGTKYQIRLSRIRPEAWVSLDNMSDLAVGAVVVSEDWAFFDHKGFDGAQIRDALWDSIQEGKLTRGASTITQQVVKNVFLTSERSLWRKVKELVLSRRVERSLSKRKILEIYLNIAQWGRGIYGIGSASWHYFEKHPSLLTAKEGAFLAMLLPSPVRYAESFRKREPTPYARRTMRSILKKMKQAHLIDAELLAHAMEEPLEFERTQHLDSLEGAEVDFEEMEELDPVPSDEEESL